VSVARLFDASASPPEGSTSSAASTYVPGAAAFRSQPQLMLFRPAIGSRCQEQVAVVCVAVHPSFVSGRSCPANEIPDGSVKRTAGVAASGLIRSSPGPAQKDNAVGTVAPFGWPRRSRRDVPTPTETCSGCRACERHHETADDQRQEAGRY
jgi:hypothetical protein